LATVYPEVKPGDLQVRWAEIRLLTHVRLTPQVSGGAPSRSLRFDATEVTATV
jgi:hypothetical protein